MSTNGSPPGLIVMAVDDEPKNLDELCYLLRQNPRVRRVLEASDALEALRIIRGQDPELQQRIAAGLPAVDAVFADIQMPGLSGVEMATVITGLKDAPALVFVTGHGDHALAAYNLGALDYISKPPNPERLERVLRLIERTSMATVAAPAEEPVDEEVIPVELAGTTKLIPRAAVRYVEAQGDYARLHTAEGSHLVRIPLAQLEERWGDAGFVRIHRSYLVAMGLITELKMATSGYTVRVGSGEDAVELPVSRRHTRELKDRLVRSPKNNWGHR